MLGTSRSLGAMQRSRSALSLSRQSSRDSCVFRSDADPFSESSRSRGVSPCSPTQRRASHEVDAAQSTAVRVVVRFRPLLPGEADWDESAFIVNSEQNRVESRDLQHWFQFDRVFDQETLQSQFCEEIALPLADDVMQGYNGTILAYGQTGGGKTHCMFGSQGQQSSALQGLVPRAADHIFKNVGASHIECNFLEVYCEQLRDLLTSNNSKLLVKESPNRGFWVDGLTHRAVSSTADVLQVLRTGLKQRAAANTRLNQHSSRSHAIFTLHVVQHTAAGNVRRSKLTLVDLAGSEKVNKSGSSGETLEEAKKINSSLSALGHVIDALAEKRPHVPYRDSRLTRLLEDSLGGNCRTTLLVACSPADNHSAETLSALRFAGRAKKVCNMVHLPRTYEDRQLVNRITSLRRELAKAHQELERRVDQGKSPRKSHRALLRSLEESNLDGLMADSGSTRLFNSKSLCSLSSLPGCQGGTPALESRSLGGSGASREDYAEARSSPFIPISAMSPRESSDTASTAVGSGSSSAVVLAGSASETPLSSWDAGDDDLIGRKANWPAQGARHDRGDHMLPTSRIIGTLEAALSRKDSCSGKDGSSCESDQIPGDVHIQQDLSWKLELERHRSAALSFELSKRAQESMDLRRRLNEAESHAHSWAPGFIASGTPRFTSNATIPYSLSHVPVPVPVTEATTIVTTTTTTIHAPVKIQTTRTPSHSPLRCRNASYGGGIQHTQPVSAPWLSPRVQQTPLRRSDSQTCTRLYSAEVPVACGPSRVSPCTSWAASPHLSARSPRSSMVNLQGAFGSSQGAPPPVSNSGRARFEPPVPLVPGAAADKGVDELREELQRWVNSVM